jgi:hypothetical protein
MGSGGGGSFPAAILNGQHTAGSWQVTSTSFSDFNPDATAAYSTVVSTTLSAVANASDLPGIDVSGLVANAWYIVSATFPQYGSISDSHAIRLTNDLVQVIARAVETNNGATVESVTLQGTYFHDDVTTTATFKLQGCANSGQIVVGDIGFPAANPVVIEWSIHRIA